MEIKTKTIKIGKDTITNDTKNKKITKNKETLKNYCILDIQEDGTITYQNQLTIGSFNIHQTTLQENDPLPEIIQKLTQTPKPKTTKTKQNTKQKQEKINKTPTKNNKK